MAAPLGSPRAFPKVIHREEGTLQVFNQLGSGLSQCPHRHGASTFVHYFYCYFIYFYFLAVLHGMWDLGSVPGIKPMPLALEVQSLNHQTREVNHQGSLTDFSNGNSWVLKWAELRISHCFSPPKTLSSIFAWPTHLSLSSSPSQATTDPFPPSSGLHPPAQLAPSPHRSGPPGSLVVSQPHSAQTSCEQPGFTAHRGEGSTGPHLSGLDRDAVNAHEVF